MSKKIILRQSVKSGVAVVFFFGLGMASINAQTTQTTQPIGKVGINTTNPTETLDVKGKVRIQGLYSENDETGTELSETNKKKTFTATDVVTANANGVLGRKPLSSIIMPTIPTEPWQVAGGSTQATTNTQNIYQNGKVGIGNYSANSTMESSFEINEGGSKQLGLVNTFKEKKTVDNINKEVDVIHKWDISTENYALTFTKRKPDNGRIFSVTQDAKLYLGNTLTTPGGGNTKITLDGKDGNIILIDKWRVGLKDNSLMFYNSSTTGDSNNKFTLTNEGKLFLGKGLNGDGNGTGANILLDGKDGKVAIGKNSANYTLEVNGDTGIKGQLNLIDSSDDNNKFLTYTEGTQLLFDKKITVPLISATTTQTGVMASLTNVGKLYLGSGLTKPNGETLYTKNANILLDGQDGKVAIGKNSAEYNLDVKGNAKISGLPDKGASDTVKMVVVDDSGVLKKAAIPTGGGSGNGVTKHTTTTPTCNAANAGTIHYKEGVTVNGQPTSVMGFCMKTAGNKYRWFYIFGGAGTTAGSEADAPNFGEGIQ